MAKYKVNHQHFDYFDQFKEMEIDLSKFLEKFSSDKYKLKFSNLQPVTVSIKNLFEQYKILDRYKRDSSSFNEYNIQDNELIENISYKFYDTISYWWIVAVFNDIRNPFYDLPLSEQQLIDYSEILEEREGKYPKDIYYKLLFEANEERRQINVPKTEFIADIIWEFRQAIIKDR